MSTVRHAAISKANVSDLTGMSRRELYYCISNEIAVALQRGNASALTACYQGAVDRADGPVFYVSLDSV